MFLCAKKEVELLAASVAIGFLKIGNKIIYGLKCAKALQELDYDYKDKNKTKLLNKRVEKTFTLIGKHLFTLWD